MPPLVAAAIICISVGLLAAEALVVVQINDVYELKSLLPVSDLHRDLAAQHPEDPPFIIVCGDFLHPSVFNILTDAHERPIVGRHMVDVLNEMGVAFAIPGNHEFDLAEEDFLRRVNESRFRWLSANVRHCPAGHCERAAPFARFEEFAILTDPASDATFALVAVTTPVNAQPYVLYDEPLAAARRVIDSIRRAHPNITSLVALTHLPVAEDLALAAQHPELRRILGGHDHDDTYIALHGGRTVLTKAAANAGTVYVHRFSEGEWRPPQRVDLRDKTAPTAPAATRVGYWQRQADLWYSRRGLNADEVLRPLTDVLDARDSRVRHGTTAVSKLIAAALHSHAPSADLILFNSGLLRIDSKIEGSLRTGDLHRMLLYPNDVHAVRMPRHAYERLLAASLAQVGNGGHIHFVWARAEAEAEAEAEPLEALTNTYMLLGREPGYEWFGWGAAELSVRNVTQDLFATLVRYLQWQRDMCAADEPVCDAAEGDEAPHVHAPAVAAPDRSNETALGVVTPEALALALAPVPVTEVARM